MANISTIDLCKEHLFSTAEVMRQEKYTETQIARVLRLRDMYSWVLANPDAKDRQFIEEELARGYAAHRSQAYADLAVIKALMPLLTSASREFHRWRYNEMILETYQMAKSRKDSKTMEKAASAYAKFNRVDLEDEQAVPYDLIVVQPFTATDDPTVLGIKPIPRLQERIQELLHKYRADNLDIEDIEFEEADLEEQSLFPKNEETEDGAAPEENIL